MLLKSKDKIDVKIIVYKTENELVKHLKLDLDKQIKELIDEGFSKEKIKESDLSLNIGGNFFPKLEYVHIKFNFVFSSILKKLGKKDNCIYYKINCNKIDFFKDVDFEFKEKDNDFSLNDKNYIFFSEVNMSYCQFKNEFNLSKIVFNNDFRMLHSIFENGIYFYEVYFYEKSIFYSSLFNNRVYFSNSLFNDEAEFTDTIFFCDINFSDIYYIHSILLDNIHCPDNDIKLFISTSRCYDSRIKISYISLKNTVLYKLIFKDCDIGKIDLIGSSINNFELINSDYNNFKNWQTARILKNEELKKSNNIKALEYEAIEINLYRKELLKKKNKRVRDIADIASICLGHIYSSNCQNWIQALGITLLSIFVIFSIFYTNNLDTFNIFIYLQNIIQDVQTDNYWYRFIEYLIPTKYEHIMLYMKLETIPLYKKLFGALVYFLGKISFWYGSVHIIQSFRKFNRVS